MVVEYLKLDAFQIPKLFFELHILIPTLGKT